MHFNSLVVAVLVVHCKFRKSWEEWLQVLSETMGLEQEEFGIEDDNDNDW
jgi:hypothetical protein